MSYYQNLTRVLQKKKVACPNGNINKLINTNEELILILEIADKSTKTIIISLLYTPNSCKQLGDKRRAPN